MYGFIRIISIVIYLNGRQEGGPIGNLRSQRLGGFENVGTSTLNTKPRSRSQLRKFYLASREGTHSGESGGKRGWSQHRDVDYFQKYRIR